MITESLTTITHVGGIGSAITLGVLFLGAGAVNKINDHLDDATHRTKPETATGRHRLPGTTDATTTSIRVADIRDSVGDLRYYGPLKPATASATRP